MSQFQDDAHEPGSAKRTDYREPFVCSLCGGTNGHYAECAEVAR